MLKNVLVEEDLQVEYMFAQDETENTTSVGLVIDHKCAWEMSDF